MRPQPGPKPDFLVKSGGRIGQNGGIPPPAKAWQSSPPSGDKTTGIPVKKFRDSVGLENENIRRGSKLDRPVGCKEPPSPPERDYPSPPVKDPTPINKTNSTAIKVPTSANKTFQPANKVPAAAVLKEPTSKDASLEIKNPQPAMIGSAVERQSRLQVPGSKLGVPSNRSAVPPKRDPSTPKSDTTENTLSRSEMSVPKNSLVPPKRDLSSKRDISNTRPSLPSYRIISQLKNPPNNVKNPPKMGKIENVKTQALGMKATSPPVGKIAPQHGKSLPNAKIVQNGKMEPTVSQNGRESKIMSAPKSEQIGVTKLELPRSRLQKNGVIREPSKNGAVRDPLKNGTVRDSLKNGARDPSSSKPEQNGGGGSNKSSRAATPTTKRKFQPER